jgi:glycosyltransferase involved in cell wall biosynthesis
MKAPTSTSEAVVLIPALDEARTIARVVEVALAAGVGPVLVIDDGSSDGTAAAAAAAGAEVLRLEPNRGKGGALAAGAKARTERVAVLLDADLTGLRPEHVQALLAPVVDGRADMTRGVFVGGRLRTNLAQRLMPVLNGQRALPRALLLEVEGIAESRYGVEVAIAEHASRRGWRTLDVDLRGVSQVMKEEKRGPWRGFLIRLGMYADIAVEAARRWLRPRRRAAPAPVRPRARTEPGVASVGHRNTPRR